MTILMKYKLLIFLLPFFALAFGQSGSVLQKSMFSADANFGYNLSRVNTNYYFEQTFPTSFQWTWQKANYLDDNLLNKYGYSDFGLTFLFHDFHDTTLGKNFGLYSFMEFYLWHPLHKWHVTARVSLGIAYNTHPYHKIYNQKNMLFGSHWLFPIDLGIWLKSPKILKKWRLQTGFSIFHYSNGNIQSPNYGANIPSASIGLIYDLRKDSIILNKQKLPYDKKWQYVVFLRGGFNESDYTDSGVFTFYIPGFQVEKHLNFRHKLIMGTEFFVSYFLKELIRHEYRTMPEYHIQKISDFKRLGVYLEHEFFYQKFGIDIGMGYYVYYPYPFQTRYYNRVGVKYYINHDFRLSYTIKTYGFNKAEAMEFSLMYKLN